MKATPDTNIFVRVITRDDIRQAHAAEKLLAAASVIAVPTSTLCEIVWVLMRGYRMPRARLSQTLRNLVNANAVVVDRPAVEAGLAMLDAGGDFADGVIAYEGEALGADEFVSFDKRAVTALKARGVAARLLG